MANKKNGLGRILQLLRIANDLSIKELSEKMDVSSAYICEVEANRKMPTIDMLSRFSEALGVSRGMILSFDDQGKKNDYNYKQLLLDMLQEMINIQKGNRKDESESTNI